MDKIKNKKEFYKIENEVSDYCQQKYIQLDDEIRDHFSSVDKRALDMFTVENARRNLKCNLIAYLAAQKQRYREKEYERIMRKFKEHVFQCIEVYKNEKI